MNSTTLATTTHRVPRKVADGISTRVGVQIINKWRVKMTPKKIYKVEDPSWREDQKIERENTVAIKNVLISYCDQYTMIVVSSD